MGDLGVNSRDLVDRVWHEVALRDSLAAEPLEREWIRPVELAHDLERHYINAHCILDTTPTDLVSVGRLAKAKSQVKRRAGLFIVAVLNRYFTDERDFLAHLVRYQNNVAEAHDQLGREIAALEHMMRVESRALKQRMAILHEAVEELQQAPRNEGLPAAQ